jgi:uncharacterized protein YciI
MGLYLITCLDKPGALDQRIANRPDHVAYLKTQEAMIRIAGPQLDAAGQMCGSMFVIEAADLDAARAFNAGDPFVQREVFGEVSINGFTATMGSWKDA